MSAAPGPGPTHPRAGGTGGPGAGTPGAPGVVPPRTNAGASGSRPDGPQNIATAITDVSERMAVLVHEEVELAKAEVTEKAAKLARGAVVAVAAGIFVVTALFFVLIGFAWLLYYELPIGNEFTYFWGFFAMASDPARARRARGAGGRQSRQKKLPAGAYDGDRRGPPDPRDDGFGRRARRQIRGDGKGA